MSNQVVIDGTPTVHHVSNANQPTCPFEVNYERRLPLWSIKFVSHPIDIASKLTTSTFKSVLGPYIILPGSISKQRSTLITDDPPIGYYQMSVGQQNVANARFPEKIRKLKLDSRPMLTSQEALTGIVPLIDSLEMRSFQNTIVNNYSSDFQDQSLFRIVMHVMNNHSLLKHHMALQYSAYTVGHLKIIDPMMNHIAVPLGKACSPNFLKSLNFYTVVNGQQLLIHENSTVAEMQEAKKIYLDSTDFRKQTNGGPREMRLLIDSYYGFLSFVVFDAEGKKTVYESPQVTAGDQRPTIEIALLQSGTIQNRYYSLIRYNVTFDGKQHRYNFWNHRYYELEADVEARHKRISEYVASLQSKETHEKQQDTPDQSSPEFEQESVMGFQQWKEYIPVTREEFVTKARNINSSSVLPRPVDRIDSLTLEVTDHQSFYRIMSKVLNKRLSNYSYDKSMDKVKEISEHIIAALKEANSAFLEDVSLKGIGIEQYLDSVDFREQQNAGPTEFQLLTKYWNGDLRIVVFDSQTGVYTSYPSIDSKIVPRYEVALRCQIGDDSKRLYQLITYTCTIESDCEGEDQQVWEYSELELPGEAQERYDYIKRFIVGCHHQRDTSFDSNAPMECDESSPPTNAHDLETTNQNEDHRMGHRAITKDTTYDDVDMKDAECSVGGTRVTTPPADSIHSENHRHLEVKTPEEVTLGENLAQPPTTSPYQGHVPVDRTNVPQTSLTVNSPNIQKEGLVQFDPKSVCRNNSGDKMMLDSGPHDKTPPKPKPHQDLNERTTTDEDHTRWPHNSSSEESSPAGQQSQSPLLPSPQLKQIPVTGSKLPSHLNGKTPKEMMEEFHYCVLTPEYLKQIRTVEDEAVPAWNLTQSLVGEGKNLHGKSDPPGHPRSTISGGVTQRAIPILLNATLGTGGDEEVNWNCPALKTEQELGEILMKVTSLEEWKMKPRFPKLLTVPKGLGEQFLHADTERGWAHHDDPQMTFPNDPIVSMILYCTDTMSTRLPTYVHAATQHDHRPDQDLNTIDIKFFLPESYVSFSVEAGTIVLFKHDVIHGGPTNQSEGDRIVWFDTFTRKPPTKQTPARKIDEYVHWIWFHMWYLFNGHVDHPRYIEWAKHWKSQIDQWANGPNTQGKKSTPKDTHRWELQRKEDGTITYLKIRKSSPSRNPSTCSTTGASSRSTSTIPSSTCGLLEYLRGQTNMLCIQTIGREPYSPLHPGELVLTDHSKDPSQSLCPDMPLCLVWVQVVDEFNKLSEDPSRFLPHLRVSPLLPYWLPRFDDNSQRPPSVLGLVRAAFKCPDSKCAEGNHQQCIYKDKYFENPNKRLSISTAVKLPTAEANLEKYSSLLRENESIQVCRYDSVMSGMTKLSDWPTTSNRLSGLIKSCWSTSQVAVAAASNTRPIVFRVLHSNDDPKSQVTKDVFRPLIPAPSYLISGVNSPVYDCTPAAWFPFNAKKPAQRRFATAYHQRHQIKKQDDSASESLSGPVHIGSVIQFIDKLGGKQYGIVVLTFVRLHTFKQEDACQLIPDPKIRQQLELLNTTSKSSELYVNPLTNMIPVAYLNVWEISGQIGDFTVPAAADYDPLYTAMPTIKMSDVVQIIDVSVAFPSSQSDSEAQSVTTKWKLNRYGCTKSSDWQQDTQSSSHTGILNRLNSLGVWNTLQRWLNDSILREEIESGGIIEHDIYEHAADSFNIESAIDLLGMSPLHQSSLFFNGNAPVPELCQVGRTRHTRGAKNAGDEKRRNQGITHSNNYPLNGPSEVDLPERSQTYIFTRNVDKTAESLLKNCTSLQVSIIPATGRDEGRGLKTNCALKKDDLIGYVFGKCVDEDTLRAIFNGNDPTVAKDEEEEDYATPAMNGNWRAVSTNMTECGADHILVSEQCPMGLINDGIHGRSSSTSVVNVEFKFPTHLLELGKSDSYQQFKVYATKDIMSGEELFVDYNWPLETWKIIRSRNKRHPVRDTSDTVMTDHTVTGVDNMADSSTSASARKNRHTALSERQKVAKNAAIIQGEDAKRKQKQSENERLQREQERLALKEKEKEMRAKAKAEQKQAQREKKKKQEKKEAEKVQAEKKKSKKNMMKKVELKKRKREANSDSDDSEEDGDAMQDVAEKKEEKTKEPPTKRQKQPSPSPPLPVHSRNTRSNPMSDQEDVLVSSKRQSKKKSTLAAPPLRQNSTISAVAANTLEEIGQVKSTQSDGIPLQVLKFLCSATSQWWSLASIPSTVCVTPPLSRFFDKHRKQYDTVPLKIKEQYPNAFLMLTLPNSFVAFFLQHAQSPSGEVEDIPAYRKVCLEWIVMLHNMHKSITSLGAASPFHFDSVHGTQPVIQFEQSGFTTPISNRTSAPTPLLTPITTTPAISTPFETATASSPELNQFPTPVAIVTEQPKSETNQLLQKIATLLEKSEGAHKELMQQNAVLHQSSQDLSHDLHRQTQFNLQQLSTQMSQQIAIVSQNYHQQLPSSNSTVQQLLQPHSMPAEVTDSKGQQQSVQGYSVATPIQARTMISSGFPRPTFPYISPAATIANTLSFSPQLQPPNLHQPQQPPFTPAQFTGRT